MSFFIFFPNRIRIYVSFKKLLNIFVICILSIYLFIQSEDTLFFEITSRVL